MEGCLEISTEIIYHMQRNRSVKQGGTCPLWKDDMISQHHQHVNSRSGTQFLRISDSAGPYRFTEIWIICGRLVGVNNLKVKILTEIVDQTTKKNMCDYAKEISTSRDCRWQSCRKP